MRNEMSLEHEEEDKRRNPCLEGNCSIVYKATRTHKSSESERVNSYEQVLLCPGHVVSQFRHMALRRSTGCVGYIYIYIHVLRERERDHICDKAPLSFHLLLTLTADRQRKRV